MELTGYLPESHRVPTQQMDLSWGGKEVDTKEQGCSPPKGEKKNTPNITEEAANIGLEISVLCMSDRMHMRFFRGSNILSFRE